MSGKLPFALAMVHSNGLSCLWASNAPAAFQCFMNDIFKDLLDVSVLCYLENILIYLDNMEDHQKHVKEVLTQLCKNGLFAHGDKCEFHKTRVEYLGYILYEGVDIKSRPNSP